MSQVITTQDKLNTGRNRTKKEEHQIDKEGVFKKWRRNDISKGYDPFAKLVGIILLPVVGIWSLMTAIATFALWLTVSVSRFLGEFFHLFGKK